MDDGAELAGALDSAGADVAGAADVGVVVVPPPQPDRRAARANADKPMLRCFFICCS
jgi:hypothetical protein